MATVTLEQSPLRHRRLPHEPRRADPSVRGQAHCRGQDQEGDHPLPQAIHRPRDLPDPRIPVLTKSLDFGALTNIEASLDRTHTATRSSRQSNGLPLPRSVSSPDTNLRSYVQPSSAGVALTVNP